MAAMGGNEASLRLPPPSPPLQPALCGVDGVDFAPRVRTCPRWSRTYPSVDFWVQVLNRMRRRSTFSTVSVLMVGDSICRQQFAVLVCALQAAGAHRMRVITPSRPGKDQSRNNSANGKPPLFEQLLAQHRVIDVSPFAGLHLILGILDVATEWPPLEKLLQAELFPQIRPDALYVYLASMKAHRSRPGARQGHLLDGYDNDVQKVFDGMARLSRTSPGVGLQAGFLRHVFYRPATASHFQSGNGQYGGNATGTGHGQALSPQARNFLNALTTVELAHVRKAATAPHGGERWELARHVDVDMGSNTSTN